MAAVKEFPGKVPSARLLKQQRQDKRRKGQIRNVILIGIILMAFALLLSTFFNADQNVTLRPPAIGQTMSDLALTDLDGKTVHLSDYAGTPVVINAWATWCPPCKAEMPDLQAFYEAHKAEGFTLLAINAGEERSTIKEFISGREFTFPVLLDPGNNALNRMRISSFPTSILIRKDGTVKGIHVGMFTHEQIQVEILPLLSS